MILLASFKSRQMAGGLPFLKIIPFGCPIAIFRPSSARPFPLFSARALFDKEGLVHGKGVSTSLLVFVGYLPLRITLHPCINGGIHHHKTNPISRAVGKGS
ncbi:hypothetical protein EJ08DRAFT_168169 [Tothia fuscella]|uniref:Uncharacterized protein n=1 Tax=Tothia fuscella TaxID=1048955 RepID=A0A9P4NVH2_9PEZI|nr:hypothetical protein EJ08DRAFT_168169 [Tothia fuscella]